jgi:hypothetical protein
LAAPAVPVLDPRRDKAEGRRRYGQLCAFGVLRGRDDGDEHGEAHGGVESRGRRCGLGVDSEEDVSGVDEGESKDLVSRRRMRGCWVELVRALYIFIQE